MDIDKSLIIQYKKVMESINKIAAERKYTFYGPLGFAGDGTAAEIAAYISSGKTISGVFDGAGWVPPTSIAEINSAISGSSAGGTGSTGGGSAGGAGGGASTPTSSRPSEVEVEGTLTRATITVGSSTGPHPIIKTSDGRDIPIIIVDNPSLYSALSGKIIKAKGTARAGVVYILSENIFVSRRDWDRSLPFPSRAEVDSAVQTLSRFLGDDKIDEITNSIRGWARDADSFIRLNNRGLP